MHFFHSWENQAWSNVICVQNSLCRDAALHLSGPLCEAERNTARWQKKEMQTCRLVSFHLLPGITAVHQADFGPGPSPWFPRFAWLSRRQQPPPRPPLFHLRNASAVLPPIPLSSSYPCCLPATPHPGSHSTLCPWGLTNHRHPFPHSCTLFHCYSVSQTTPIIQL